jgi:membrane-bound lytic murein transglycosylase A
MRRLTAGLVLGVLGLLVWLNMTTASQVLSPVAFSDVSGWSADRHNDALAAFRRSCSEILTSGNGFARTVRFGGEREDWLGVCGLAETAHDGKSFFEENFQALAVADPDRPEGLFTGYFEPEAEGSRTEDAAFPVPVYRKPHDLTGLDTAAEQRLGLKYGRIVDGHAMPYFTRAEIEGGALAGRGLELVWLRDWADAFFIHIQGSGRVRFSDGSAMRLAYGAKTGQPYTGIGGVLVERGILTRETMSMQGIRGWMKDHPAEARQLMQENKSFIFFREVHVADEALGAPGAQYVQLTPRRSLAVDRSLWMFGTPLWIATTTPPDAPGGAQPFNHLMIAQDTGTAIKGYARGDVYWGWGAEAAEMAGRMKSPGRMIVLLPKPLAARLLQSQ